MLDAPRDRPTERLRLLRRAEYERMAEIGLFEGERVELLAGQIVTMSPIGSRHFEAVKRLTKLMITMLGDRADVGIQSSFALSDWSEPEPDVAIVEAADYTEALPTKALLLIEVAESSLRTDRTLKAALYAAEAIPEYWIVDIDGRSVEVLRAPRGGKYTRVTRHTEGDTLHPLSFPDLAVAVRDILPSPPRKRRPARRRKRT